MQLLFVHPNFPGQFGPLLSRLSIQADLDCVVLSANASGLRGGVRCIPFQLRGAATESTHQCSRTFENAVWSAHGVYEICEAAQLDPDVIIGHSGFDSKVFLQELSHLGSSYRSTAAGGADNPCRELAVRSRARSKVSWPLEYAGESLWN